jgi:hypothetical protein
MHTELEEFSRCWEHQTEGTIALMRALPLDQYDFRPDAGRWVSLRGIWLK